MYLILKVSLQDLTDNSSRILHSFLTSTLQKKLDYGISRLGYNQTGQDSSERHMSWHVGQELGTKLEKKTRRLCL